MKKALIAYFSQGGTTARIAKEISKGLSEKDYEVDIYSITEESPPDVMEYDLIGIGSGPILSVFRLISCCKK